MMILHTERIKPKGRNMSQLRLPGAQEHKMYVPEMVPNWGIRNFYKSKFAD